MAARPGCWRRRRSSRSRVSRCPSRWWVLAALAIGFAAPGAFAAGAHGKAKDGPPAVLNAALAADPDRIARMAAAARRAGLIALALWVWPVVLLMGVPLWDDIAVFFSKMAVVTFGGSYAALAYVAQEAVENYRWLTAPEMLAGLGLAETTPGPLILVLQFVGFLAGYRDSGVLGGVGATLLTLFVSFAPCFARIFLGAPFVERMHDQPRLKGALAGAPSWNSRPSRRVKVQVRASALTACAPTICGCGRCCASRPNSWS
jgi:chromate transporter